MMTHREITELLPWYANATLNEKERREVETHLAGCQECAHELEGLTALRQAVVDLEDSVPAPSPLQLHRALAEIEDLERARAQKLNKRAERVSRFREWITLFRADGWRSTPFFARALVAVQVVLILGLGTATIYKYTHPTVVIEYRTVTRPIGQGNGAMIVVAFQPGASEQDLRQTIAAIDGQIVAGPSALGLYTIELKVPRENAGEVGKVIESLRKNQRVVREVEQAQ